jgi:hypothetical protein
MMSFAKPVGNQIIFVIGEAKVMLDGSGKSRKCDTVGTSIASHV